jgi:hypothetical protein
MESMVAPWAGCISFPIFEFEAMFHSLIDDPQIRDHLLIDWDKPSAIPDFAKGWLNEVHSARWYRRTHCLKIKTGSNKVLCGIIFFLDHTFTAGNDHQGCKCLFFTLSMIPRSL